MSDKKYRFSLTEAQLVVLSAMIRNSLNRFEALPNDQLFRAKRTIEVIVQLKDKVETSADHGRRKQRLDLKKPIPTKKYHYAVPKPKVQQTGSAGPKVE